MKKQEVILGFILIGVIWISCHNSKETPQIVARVGNAVLTREMVEREIPKDLSTMITQDKKRSFVRRWIDSEVLYQEALRRGLGQSPEIQRELEKLQKDLLISKLLDQEISSELQVSEQEIIDYYEQNKDSFIRDDDEVRFEFLILDSKKEAIAVKNEIRKGKTFEQLATEKFPLLAKDRGWDSGYVKYTDLMFELRRIIKRLSVKQLYGPLKTELGYYVIRLVDRQPRGSVRSLKEVRSEIESRLKVEKQRELYHRFLLSLKAKRKIQMNLSALEDTLVDSTIVKERE